MNGSCAESKNVIIPVDQIGQNTKNELFQYKISHTQYLRRASKKQPPEVFCEKGVLRNFTKFTGKHLCQSLFFNKVAGLGLQLY